MSGGNYKFLDEIFGAGFRLPAGLPARGFRLSAFGLRTA